MSTDIDYLRVLGGMACRVKKSGVRAPADLTEKLVDCGMDSLDTVLLTVYVCEVFGIPEEIGKNLKPVAFTDITAFIERHGTRRPATEAEAFAIVDGQ